jgi:hypothetical protein
MPFLSAALVHAFMEFSALLCGNIPSMDAGRLCQRAGEWDYRIPGIQADLYQGHTTS